MTFGLTYPFARTVGTVDAQLSMRLAAVGAAGYIFNSGAALLGTLSYSASGDATINGVEQMGSGQQQLTLGAAGGLPLTRTWRMQGSLFSDLPVAGQNHPAGMGATIVLLRAWM